MVRGLSDGYDDEAWVTQIARPYIYELGKDIVWPVAISLAVRHLDDDPRVHRPSQPTAVERFSAGFRA